MEGTHSGTKVAVGSIGVVALVGIIILLMYALPNYARSQARLDASNQIQLNELESQATQQKIANETQKAQIRVEEAKGIAESQRIINSSLTGNYLQYLAIQAQEKMAGSQNHTQIYVPSGQNGIPLVFSADGNH